DLENELSPGADGRQTVSAGLGRGRESQRRGLEQRPHVARVRPADFVPDGFVPAAVCAAPDRRAGTLRVTATPNLHWTNGQGRRNSQGKRNFQNSSGGYPGCRGTASVQG